MTIRSRGREQSPWELRGRLPLCSTSPAGNAPRGSVSHHETLRIPRSNRLRLADELTGAKGEGATALHGARRERSRVAPYLTPKAPIFPYAPPSSFRGGPVIRPRRFISAFCLPSRRGRTHAIRGARHTGGADNSSLVMRFQDGPFAHVFPLQTQEKRLSQRILSQKTVDGGSRVGVYCAPRFPQRGGRHRFENLIKGTSHGSIRSR